MAAIAFLDVEVDMARQEETQIEIREYLKEIIRKLIIS